ncbi:hypothetical protein ALP05_02922 [Pseudomonas caricapapayae]|uniref:Glycoside hydrolase n=1 Tax=Pseudomonas caricapapayae TaxID=46678 RepID=A0A3M6EZD8_9PSED|nr:hypothetical protein ALP05_02922 [Pseudomonas caricapapayae]
MNGLFDSFFMGGFECASHRRRDGTRLDLLDSTGHSRWPQADFAVMDACAIRTVRDGLRWHLIEASPGTYDWSSFLPMLHAARHQGIQVIWDLCHYGYPDDLDIWSPQFVERFARFAAAVAQLIKDEGETAPFYSPINEISFWSWAGGDVAYFNPGSRQPAARHGAQTATGPGQYCGNRRDTHDSAQRALCSGRAIDSCRTGHARLRRSSGGRMLSTGAVRGLGFFIRTAMARPGRSSRVSGCAGRQLLSPESMAVQRPKALAERSAIQTPSRYAERAAQAIRQTAIDL